MSGQQQQLLQQYQQMRLPQSPQQSAQIQPAQMPPQGPYQFNGQSYGSPMFNAAPGVTVQRYQPHPMPVQAPVAQAPMGMQQLKVPLGAPQRPWWMAGGGGGGGGSGAGGGGGAAGGGGS